MEGSEVAEGRELFEFNEMADFLAGFSDEELGDLFRRRIDAEIFGLPGKLQPELANMPIIGFSYGFSV